MDRSPADRKLAIAAEVPRLMRYASALVRDRGLAEDLVHDCVARALANLAGWRDGDNPRRWLFTIMHNLHVDRVRARIRTPIHVSLEDSHIADGGFRPSDDVTRREIDSALAALPDEQRQCVLLVGLEGLTYAEAASVLNVPVGTVMSRLCRGREKLRELLDRDGAKPALRRIK
jgi:RNA polymerase sigma-70 factor, ECF subfamily